MVQSTRNRLASCLLVSFVMFVGCGSQPGASGDAAAGRRLFSGETPIAGGNAPICADCHSIEPGVVGAIGTNLSDIGTRAATMIPDASANEYLRTSIVDPDAYLAGGFQEGIHYRGYGEALTPEQLEDLIAYLLTLRGSQDS
jgi:mono/diheme cytochrome c family protein